MLVEFSVENFRSIKEKATLSMVATKDKSLPENSIDCNALRDDRLLNSSVVFGPNASGKSTLLQALYFLKLLVLNSHKHAKGDGIRFTPFKLDTESINKPTVMNAVFTQGDIRYAYSLAYNKEKVLEESLTYYPNKKPALIFSRTNNEFKFTKETEDQQKPIAERTVENALYFSKAAIDNFELIQKPYEWFKSQLQIILPSEENIMPGEQTTLEVIKRNPELKKTVIEALNLADLGIDDFTSERKSMPVEFFQKIPPQILDLMNQQPGNKFEFVRIITKHKGVDFDFGSEESEGTKRLFQIIGMLLEGLLQGSCIFMDELEIKLHHKLQIFLIKLFNDSTQNKKGAQLVFTTHNVNLLDEELFRRDQIWFTNKKKDMSTEIYSLTDFSPRKDKNLLKGYLAGKYDALPFIKKERIF